MTFSEFAKQLPTEFTEQKVVDLMNQVIDLQSIAGMPLCGLKPAVHARTALPCQMPGVAPPSTVK